MYVCMYLRCVYVIYVCVYVCMYADMYVLCMYECMCVYIMYVCMYPYSQLILDVTDWLHLSHFALISSAH